VSPPATSAATSQKNAIGRWHEADFDALLGTIEPGQTVVVEVGADWCGPCNQLAWEVLETPRGGAMLTNSAGLQINFETPEGQQLAGRFSVISLPTTLVINHAGRELGRVEGYTTADEYVEAVRDAQRPIDNLKNLETALAGDPHNPTLRLDLARAKLFAGQRDEATSALEELARTDGVPIEIAAEATRIQGRWLLRVRHDAAAARPFFALAAARFQKEPKHFAHFTYWTATATVAAGRRDEAAEVMHAWLKASPGDVRALSYSLEFFVHNKYPSALSGELLSQLVALDGWDADRRYTQARILYAGGDLQGAIEASRAAETLEPENALYRNYAARLAAP